MDNLEDEDKYYAVMKKRITEAIEGHKKKLMWTLNKESRFQIMSASRSLR